MLETDSNLSVARQWMYGWQWVGIDYLGHSAIHWLSAMTSMQPVGDTNGDQGVSQYGHRRSPFLMESLSQHCRRQGTMPEPHLSDHEPS